MELTDGGADTRVGDLQDSKSNKSDPASKVSRLDISENLAEANIQGVVLRTL